MNQQIGSLGELFCPQQAKHDPLTVYADRGVPAGRSGKVAHVTDSIRQGTDGNVLSRRLAGAGMVGVRTFGRKAGCHPIQLSRPVLVNLAKPPTFEPRRGSWSQISTGVPAVDNHRLAGVEGARVLFETPQRKANRTWQVVFYVLLGRKHLDEPGSLADQLLNL